jgi:hypothetical protein
MTPRVVAIVANPNAIAAGVKAMTHALIAIAPWVKAMP